MARRRWQSFLFRRGSQLPRLDPLSLIIEPDDNVGSRVVALEGAINFRDLGGYATGDGQHVRRGLLFRSGALAQLTDHDLEALQRLGVRRIFDLRTAEEMAHAPDRVPSGARYVPVTVQAETSAIRRLFALLLYAKRLDKLLLQTYTQVILERNAPLFGSIFRALAEAEGMPAIIHCTAGKDRTGVTSALLLAALGVPESTIIADYSQTNRYHEPIAALVSAQMQSLARFGLTVEDVHPLLLANPETLRAALDYLHERYGSVEGYLRQRAGVDERTLTALREMLLE